MKKITLIITILSMVLNVCATEYKSTQRCSSFIKKYEKFSSVAYWDSNGYSIGYGHHSNVKKGQRITQAKALAYLKDDVKTAEKSVNYLLNKLPYKYKFSQGFIDGFTSFVYNVGIGNAQKSKFYKRLQRCRVRNGKINKNDFDYTLVAIKTSCISSKGHSERRKGEYQMMRL